MNEWLFDEPEAEQAPDRIVHPSLWLGSAGWSYDDWEGPFYPPGTSQPDRLVHYATQFRTVEIDSTFYGAPTMRTVQGWHERTPDDFVFAAKFPRTITHEARLVRCEEETYRFVETMTELGPKLGPLLIQLPPTFDVRGFDALERFLEGLPDGLMYAVEVRHKSWLGEPFADLLKKWNVGLCVTCSGTMQRFWRVTSRFVYVRFLGRQNVIERFDEVQIDRETEIEWWIPRIRHFLDYGGTVFAYVNNNYSGHSPETIRQIARRVRQSLASPGEGGEEE